MFSRSFCQNQAVFATLFEAPPRAFPKGAEGFAPHRAQRIENRFTPESSSSTFSTAEYNQFRHPVQRDAAIQRNGMLPPEATESFQPQFLEMRSTIIHAEGVREYLSKSD
jgi:hypothetical protein